MNAVTLIENTRRAVLDVYSPASKLPKDMREFPILATVKLSTNEGRLQATMMQFDPKTESLQPVTAFIPARVEDEFSICIPARSFRDWLSASLPNPEEKTDPRCHQMQFSVCPDTMILECRHMNTRVTFKGIDPREFPAA